MRTYSHSLASQPRHRPAMDQVVTCGHFGDHESGAKLSGQTPKRCIGDARHGREKDAVSDVNIAYFQRLRA